ncbi:MAG: putative replication initiation protein [Microviridae sp.]|nr:MAG: putative replication initiation protein [Microviridae sp.]
MCLYPKLIKNRKYVPNKKNNGNPPTCTDNRVLYVPVGCQKCIECKNQKARAWGVRLHEEIKTDKTGKFVTLTFSNESIRHITQEIAKENDGIIPEGYIMDNEIATMAVRRFLERWRKKHKVSVKHWLITEIGQGKNWKYQGTENIHLHGIIWTDNVEDIKKIWQYGFIFTGKYVNESTMNYITKYITKVDKLHKEYQPKILTSAGIGKNYTNTLNARDNKYNTEKETKETYTMKDGIKINLPIYYRNKIYTETERENLWIQKIDKGIRWVMGSQTKDINQYFKLLIQARHKNKRLGYGDDTKNWDRIKYENQLRKINLEKRINKANLAETKQ